MNHWVNNYLEKKYEPDAHGPDTFSCWGLVRDVYQKVYGIELPQWVGLTPETSPEFPITRAIREEWDLCLKPFEGCAVAMSVCVSFHHVGIYLSGDRVLHTSSQIGKSCVTTLRELRIRFLFKNIKYYRHKKWPLS